LAGPPADFWNAAPMGLPKKSNIAEREFFNIG